MQQRGDFARKNIKKPQNMQSAYNPDFATKSHFPPISPRKNFNFIKNFIMPQKWDIAFAILLVESITEAIFYVREKYL